MRWMSAVPFGSTRVAYGVGVLRLLALKRICRIASQVIRCSQVKRCPLVNVRHRIVHCVLRMHDRLPPRQLQLRHNNPMSPRPDRVTSETLAGFAIGLPDYTLSSADAALVRSKDGEFE